MAAVQVTGGASAPLRDAVEGTVPRTAVPRRWPTSVVAARTGVSEMTLLRWRSRDGLGPDIGGPGYRVLYTWREMLVAACWAETGISVGRHQERLMVVRGKVRDAILDADELLPYLVVHPDHPADWLRYPKHVVMFTTLDASAWWMFPIFAIAERIGR